jgi:phage-related protein
VKFEYAVYVLHCFQKKSRRGVKTPKAEMDLIKSRLKLAQEHHDRVYKSRRETKA